MPHLKGAGFQRSPIFGVPSIYAYTLCHRTTKFHMGTGLVFMWSVVSHANATGSQRTQFWGSFLFMRTSLSQNYQI